LTKADATELAPDTGGFLSRDALISRYTGSGEAGLAVGVPPMLPPVLILSEQQGKEMAGTFPSPEPATVPSPLKVLGDATVGAFLKGYNDLRASGWDVASAAQLAYYNMLGEIIGTENLANALEGKTRDGQALTAGERGIEAYKSAFRAVATAAALLGAEEVLGAAEATPPLASVLEGHGAEQGFTGVFDDATGQVLIKPSMEGPGIAPGWVARRGGHADVSSALGGNAANHRGFAVILQKDGSLAVTWRSGVLNPSPDFVVPQAERARIIAAIEKATGRKVSSF
jgi:hypothetical protein